MLKNKTNRFIGILIIFLAISSSLISFYPLISKGPKAVIFNFEPEVAYVANALSYIGFKEISYSGHPATPSILSIAHSFIPLRIYAKYIDKIPFFLWTIRNEIFLFYYVRVFESLMFAFAISIFLYTIYRFSYSIKSVLFAWLGIFVYSNTPYLGIIPQSEPLSFLILSIWFYFFYRFLQNKNMKNYLILCALAGLSVANKLPNMFFVMASILQAFSFPKLNLKRFVNFAFSGTIVSIFLFVAGTWQIRNQYASLWEWIVKLATHSGIHGRGETSFNLATYLSSLNNLYLLETVPFFIILAITVLWFFYKNRENKYKRRSVNILLTSLLFGILIFGKFPLSHYHQFHYIGILFIGSYLCSKLPKGIYWVVITIFLVNSVNTIDNYWKINNKEANYAISLEKFVENNPPKVATVWEWGRSLDYSLIHIRDWIGIRYSVYLSQERPNLLSLTTDMNKIVLANGEQKAVFETCWDILYIQGSELPRFINKYSKQKLVAKSIPESKDMWVVSSDHCINK